VTVVIEMLDSPRVETAGAAHNPVNLVSLGEQEVGKI
jgi:hypothetical protein